MFAYCITSNHTHLLTRAETTDSVSDWMQELQGEFAQAYNRRKKRSGAFWADRYHCTMIEPGEHLWRCMVYIDLNMVRAGVVKHPSQWSWCSYGEWTGLRHRYRVVDQSECLELSGAADVTGFAAHYERLLQERMDRDTTREAEWRESIAVGSRRFVDEIASTVTGRQQLEKVAVGQNAWVLREGSAGAGPG